MLLEGGPTLAGAFVRGRAGRRGRRLRRARAARRRAPAALGDAGIGDASPTRCACDVGRRHAARGRRADHARPRSAQGRLSVHRNRRGARRGRRRRASVGDAARLTVRGPLVTSDAAHGDSIAVNGVCLTVVGPRRRRRVHRRRHGGDAATAPASARSRPGSPVNLERPVTLRGPARRAPRAGPRRRHRHRPRARRPASTGRSCASRCPPTLGRYVVEKGSITVDGVSLTVVDVGADWFTVSLIPTTLRADHARDASRPGDAGQPRGRRRRQVRREAVGSRSDDRRTVTTDTSRCDSTRSTRRRRRRSRPAGRSSSSTTRTARTRATSSSRPSKATPELVGFMVRLHLRLHLRPDGRAPTLDRLDLPPMTARQRGPQGHGVHRHASTRATASSPASRPPTGRARSGCSPTRATEPRDLTRPGHVFPLRARGRRRAAPARAHRGRRRPGPAGRARARRRALRDRQRRRLDDARARAAARSPTSTAWR